MAVDNHLVYTITVTPNHRAEIDQERVRQDLSAHIKKLLEALGEDPKREGLLKTPDRVVRAYFEMTQGYMESPAAILSTTFSDTSDEIIIVRDIEFTSLCEHHLLPFVGTATVGYLPSNRIVGLSKIPRLINCLSRRLQVQERLTQQVAQSLMLHLEAVGAGAIFTAHHSCMSCRGIRSNAQMVTSAMLGTFREIPSTRAEFLTLASLRI